MADKLTPQQEMAVTSRGGKLLVSAAAGSGKTKVLVDRLLGFLTQTHDPANLDEFLIITYTKAAASELRGKIAAKLTEEIAKHPEETHLQRQMQRLFLTKISTVHGFCSDLLREYAYKLDIAADFRVADENECREIRETVLEGLLDRAYETAGDDPDFRAFVDTQGVGRSDRQVPELVEKVYDSAHCHLNPEAWLDKCLTADDQALLAVVDALVIVVIGHVLQIQTGTVGVHQLVAVVAEELLVVVQSGDGEAAVKQVGTAVVKVRGMHGAHGRAEGHNALIVSVGHTGDVPDIRHQFVHHVVIPLFVILNAPAVVRSYGCPAFIVDGVNGEDHALAGLDPWRPVVHHFEGLKIPEPPCLTGNKDHRLAAAAVDFEFHIPVQPAAPMFFVANFHFFPLSLSLGKL